MRCVNASFAVHPNIHSHTGGGLAIGSGYPIAVVSSTKQILITQSSIESELAGVDNIMGIVLWTCYFPTAQGNGVTKNHLL
jgi:hypothetical protein